MRGVCGPRRFGLCGSESASEISSLGLAEDMSVRRQDSALIIAEVLGDFIDRRAEAQPRRRDVVTEGVATEGMIWFLAKPSGASRRTCRNAIGPLAVCCPTSITPPIE